MEQQAICLFRENMQKNELRRWKILEIFHAIIMLQHPHGAMAGAVHMDCSRGQAPGEKVA